MPVTWRNVGSNYASAGNTAGRLLDSAGEDFKSATDSVQGMMDGYTNRVTDDNTRAFMEQIQKYQTPEELAAAQESGAISNMRQEFGRLIDTDKTDANAIDSLVTNLQQRQTQQYQYDETVRNQEMTPVMQGYLSDINSLSPDMSLSERAAAIEDMQGRIFEDEKLDTRAQNQLLKQTNSISSQQDERFITRQNYFNTEEDRRKQEKAREIESAYLTERLNEQAAYDSRQKEYTTKAADILDLPVTDLNSPEKVQERLNQLPDDQYNQYQELLDTQLADTDPRKNEGVVKRGTYKSLIPLVGSTDAAQRVQTLDEQAFGLEAPTARGREKELKIKQEYEQEIGQNSYYKDDQLGQSPAEKAATLSEQLSQDEQFKEQWWDNRDEAYRFINQATAGQYAINGKDPVPIPLEYVKAALFQMEPGFINDRSATEAIEEVLGDVDLSKELSAYETAKKNKDVRMKRIQMETMGGLPGGDYQNIARGLPRERQQVAPPAPTPEPQPVQEPVTPVETAPEGGLPQNRPGMFGIDKGTNAIMQEKAQREQARQQITQNIITSVNESPEADRINEMQQKLETRSRSMGYDKRNKLRRDLLKSLPDIALENPSNSPYLDEMPTFLLNKELKRRGMK